MSNDSIETTLALHGQQLTNIQQQLSFMIANLQQTQTNDRIASDAKHAHASERLDVVETDVGTIQQQIAQENGRKTVIGWITGTLGVAAAAEWIHACWQPIIHFLTGK